MKSLHRFAVLFVFVLPSLSPGQEKVKPEEKLDALLKKAADKNGQTESLRLELLSFCRDFAGTPLHRKAAVALTALPSPLDKLDPAKIDPDLRKVVGIPEMVGFIRAHTRSIASLAFSPDSRSLASSGWDNEVRLWKIDAPEPTMIAKLDGSPSGVGFTNDGKQLATGSPQSRVVLWDITGTVPKVRVNLSGHKHRPFALQIAPRHNMLASGSLEPVLRLWKLDGDEPEIWAALANENVQSFGISSLAFSGDGRLLAAGSHLGKQTLRIWDVSGNILDELDLPAAQARIVQFAPADAILAFAGDDTTIHLWSVGGKEPTKLKSLIGGHKAVAAPPAIKALAFSPTGDRIVSSGQDRRVIVWDVAKGTKLREWALLDEVRALAFASDGRHLAVGNDDGTICILRLQ